MGVNGVKISSNCAKSMNFGMKVPKTNEKRLSRCASKVHTHEVILTSYEENFASASTHTFLLGLSNIHTKNHALS